MNRKHLLAAAIATALISSPVAIGSASASGSNTQQQQLAGFTSNFNGNKVGWSNVAGNWTLKPGNLYAKGIPGYRISTKHVSNFSNFVYTVKMKRRGNSTGTAANALVVRGNPSALNPLNYWSPSYYFQYANSGWYSIWKTNPDGSQSAVVTWATTPYVNRIGYNTVQVVASGSYLSLTLNGHLLAATSDSSYTFGQVGVDVYTEPGKNSETFVDQASLVPLAAKPRLAPLGRTGTSVSGGTFNEAPH